MTPEQELAFQSKEIVRCVKELLTYVDIRFILDGVTEANYSQVADCTAKGIQHGIEDVLGANGIVYRATHEQRQEVYFRQHIPSHVGSELAKLDIPKNTSVINEYGDFVRQTYALWAENHSRERWEFFMLSPDVHE
ncbi:MAG TPA: hypothetical protein VJH88_04700 [Candidatus Nanoarchaeia archaeon]|nr:hypothetical protein [Candidatus Nanoarchaeia archaeon]